MQFTVELQADHLKRVLEAVRGAIATPGEMLDSIGHTLYRATKERHDAGLAPDGTKWKPRAASTVGAEAWKATKDRMQKAGQISIAAARKAQGRSLLYREGGLLPSLHHQVEGGELKLSLDDPKAKWHHFGTGTYGPRGSSYEIRPKVKKALAFGGLVRSRVTHPGIPARPLLGFPASDRQLVGDVVTGHLTAVLHRAR